jgi:hypothetical protein
VPTRPDLPEVLLPQNYQPPKDLMPPSGTVVGPDGNLLAVGPPYLNPIPNLADPNPPLPPWLSPSPAIPDTANPALLPTAPPAAPLSPPAPVAPKPGDPPFPAEAAPASFGGNVGPVGSEQERRQLGVITGRPASSATQLLLGPLARGTTVSLVQQHPQGGGR